MSEIPKADPPQTEANESTYARRFWSRYLSNRRQMATVAAVIVTVFLAWHVINGRNGLSSWQKKRAEDKALAQEMDQLTAENARLSQHVERLKSDPGAIEYEARERLHYARPNEIIYALPDTNGSTKPQSAH